MHSLARLYPHRTDDDLWFEKFSLLFLPLLHLMEISGLVMVYMLLQRFFCLYWSQLKAALQKLLSLSRKVVPSKPFGTLHQWNPIGKG